MITKKFMKNKSGEYECRYWGLKVKIITITIVSPIRSCLTGTRGVTSGTSTLPVVKEFQHLQLLGLIILIILIKISAVRLRWPNTVFQYTDVSKHYLKTTYF